ncbi:autotransporter strand-loop-strand O-heptosyltransferase [Lichenicola sp.]|uniref:autotransporter strand-loop-strand O-heptosyltransferase n=1 Tax=Lichenicola sp. TaxID=2804529 RepID=UPI003AFFF51E
MTPPAVSASTRISAIPACIGPHGVRFDFNEGCRILLPPGNWQVRLTDLETGSVLCDAASAGGTILSLKKYFVRFHIELRLDGSLVFDHRLDLREREVLIRMELGGLGDQLAWIGQAASFAVAHAARVTCCVAPALVPLLGSMQPELRLVTAAELATLLERTAFYATYKVCIFYNDHDHDWQPSDYRQVGLSHAAAHILGLSLEDRRPKLSIDPGGRPIDEPYVCIATQATSQAKYWNNPLGWTQVIAFLKQAGYRVICIDRQPVNGSGLVWNHLPHGAEDETGDRPLSERARWLRHAAFFVGLSSGLSWLAWAVGTEVVMIGGFTLPLNEFAATYRVTNDFACNGCANDLRHQFNPRDFLFCPRHAGTARQFECSRLITAQHVQTVIERIPGFGAHRQTVSARVGRAA